jgi:hypothetical protein
LRVAAAGVAWAQERVVFHDSLPGYEFLIRILIRNFDTKFFCIAMLEHFHFYPVHKGSEGGFPKQKPFRTDPVLHLKALQAMMR